MQFQFHADDLTLAVPWAQPDLFRLKLWQKQTWSTWPCRIALKAYLYGDYWSSGMEQAQSLSLWLETQEPWASFAATDWSLLRDHLRGAFQQAVERYRLLLHIGIGEPDSARRVGELILRAEVEESLAHLTADLVPQRLELIATMQTVRQGVLGPAISVACTERNSQAFGGWHLADSSHLHGFAAQAARGRVFYKPVTLTELLHW